MHAKNNSGHSPAREANLNHSLAQQIQTNWRRSAVQHQDHIQRVLDQAPPLTADQLDRIASLFRVGAA